MSRRRRLLNLGLGLVALGIVVAAVFQTGSGLALGIVCVGLGVVFMARGRRRWR